MGSNSPLEFFSRMVRERSRENARALGVLMAQGLLGHVIGVLRQELDSLVRVIYLLSIEDANERARLVRAAVGGKRWTKRNGRGLVTDRSMVEVAQQLNGWTRSVYEFGCAFIHLSSYHDYMSRDPLDALNPSERQHILRHMRSYHGGPASDSPTFQELACYLPQVFHKIQDNLGSYLRSLEQGGRLE